MRFSDNITERFDEPWMVEMGDVKQLIYSGVRMGIIQMKSVIDSYPTLLNLVERVLSFARSEDKSILFDEKMDKQYREHTKLLVSLKACILNQMEGFTLNFQPLVDATTGKWVGMETLCRWNSPDMGNIPPDIFILEAEHLGMISIIDKWVLEEAIKQAKLWGLDKKDKFLLSVNLSPIQLRDKELANYISVLLQKYDFPANKLSLEITESVEVQFDEITLSLLHKMEELGIKLSLDDFGIGYSSFASIKNLPISVLKIDRSFIKGIEDDIHIQHTLRIMVEFAHLSGLVVITEGVETLMQHEIVRENGTNYIQGFYFSKPLSVEVMQKNLHNFS